MKSYNPESVCQKCGNEGKKLIDGNKEIVFRAAADTKYSEKADALIRVCRRCGYHWIEACV